MCGGEKWFIILTYRCGGAHSLANLVVEHSLSTPSRLFLPTILHHRGPSQGRACQSTTRTARKSIRAGIEKGAQVNTRSGKKRVLVFLILSRRQLTPLASGFPPVFRFPPFPPSLPKAPLVVPKTFLALPDGLIAVVLPMWMCVCVCAERCVVVSRIQLEQRQYKKRGGRHTFLPPTRRDDRRRADDRKVQKIIKDTTGTGLWTVRTVQYLEQSCEVLSDSFIKLTGLMSLGVRIR